MAKVILEKIYKSFPNPINKSLKQTDSEKMHAAVVNVLRCINLTIADGEFMVLVGPSGCGKSTLLRLIAGLDEVTAGQIWVGDTLVNQIPPKARDIAMVFQNYALYPHLSVYDNIAFGLRRMKVRSSKEPLCDPQNITDHQSRAILPQWLENSLIEMTRKLPSPLRYPSEKETEIEQIVQQVAELLQIDHLLDRVPKQLSGGQKQRVALGRAIARNPQVFLMDEPLSNLDAKLRTETRAQIVKLQQQLGITTIYVTHDQTEAMTMGDRIAVMNQGEILQIASPLEIYHYPVNLFVAEFIGTPPMNFIPVVVNAPLLITHSAFRLTLPETWKKSLAEYDTRSLILGIRPEHLNLSPPATKNLAVQVDMIEALGNDTYLTVHLIDEPNLTLQARIPPETVIRRGDNCWLSLSLDKIHLFEPNTGKAIWVKA